ncbi:transcriptional regulator with XRE-family HTH domain [Brevibacillus aydinogluensis]|jgi:transcriptional regulator with XRE-family HTH domain|uniref:helix-turn-helix domain-containing protein n=1 Tax=Brevibacillus aydinogluensis TaxID=927786 RepID=UPI002892F4AA|nr:helix-turn-helix domain-containing protein [Brevibacillus aydinogluensis]MDT3417199.1 transcriptional regulator with XRE-family HTH domain [Brevibacillus aydinogluensis]
MFGQRLRLLRKMKKMTQQELADYLQVAKTTISSYEKGVNEPSHETLMKLADLFEVSTDFLLGRTDIKERHRESSPLMNRLMLSEEQIEKIEELYEILFSLEDKEERDKIIDTAILFANGVKMRKRQQ